MRKTACVVIFCAMAGCLYAQQRGAQPTAERLDDKEINFLDNAFTGTKNPAALSFNTVHTLTRATIGTRLTHGAFHSLDESSRHNDLSVDISGLKRIGKLSLSGNIAYVNAKDYSHRWNTTALLSPRNPFILADSVPSDVSNECFDMHVTASLRLTECLTTAMRLKFTTTSLSDQTDPRPKVNAMRFAWRPGLLWRLNARNSVGVSADMNLYRSDISHTVVDNLTSETYFIMRGMGDNIIFTTEGNTNYPRDYSGTKLGAFAQWHTQTGHLSNIVELGITSNNENAEDGGTAYTYKGGDYTATQLEAYDRLSFAAGSLYHHLILHGAWGNDKGYWYDQQRMVDPAHGNRVYYQVLNKSKVHTSSHAGLDATYRIDRRRSSESPDRSVSITGGIATQETKHYEADVYRQKYNRAHVALDINERWKLKSCRITATLGASYATALGTPTYSSVRDKLVDSYSKPMFEYATATQAGIKARLAADFPVRMYGVPTWLTVYARSNHLFYIGSNRYTTYYKNTLHGVIDVGVSLTL